MSYLLLIYLKNRGWVPRYVTDTNWKKHYKSSAVTINAAFSQSTFVARILLTFRLPSLPRRRQTMLRWLLNEDNATTILVIYSFNPIFHLTRPAITLRLLPQWYLCSIIIKHVLLLWNVKLSLIKDWRLIIDLSLFIFKLE